MNPFNNLQQWNHGGNVTNALMQGVQFGDQIRQQKEQRARQQATDEAYRGMISGDPNAVNALAQVDPRQAYNMQQSQQAAMQKQQEQAQAQQRKQFETIAQLLDGAVDEPSYQQGLAVAKQMGMDVSQAPPNFDPNWVAQQKLFTSTFMSEPQKLTTMAQQLVDAGYQPGTPEFIQQMRLGITADRTKTLSVAPGGSVAAWEPGKGAQYIVAPDGAQMGGGIPQEAIADLKSNPKSAAQFDEVFGAGAAAKILGGGGSNATDGFR